MGEFKSKKKTPNRNRDYRCVQKIQFLDELGKFLEKHKLPKPKKNQNNSSSISEI
jgi:hypothetical protein